VGVARLLEALFSLSPVTSGEVRQYDKPTRAFGAGQGCPRNIEIAFGEINSQANFSMPNGGEYAMQVLRTSQREQVQGGVGIHLSRPEKH
jgi:hypothetical protein